MLHTVRRFVPITLLSCLLVAPGSASPGTATWLRVGLPGAKCARGGPYAFWFHRGSSSHLLLYFQDGGGCWSYETCRPGSGFFQDSLRSATDPSLPEGGILDFSDPQRGLPFWPIFSIGSVSEQGVITGGPVSVAGSTTIEGAADAEVRFEDGTSATIPVVWLSAPINAGLFGYEVPRSHWAIGHRPTLVVLHDGEGNELGRDTSAFHTPTFRHGPSTGLVPCLVRGGGSSCFGAATGGGSLLPRRSRPIDTVKHGLGWHGK
jgi:hypothetical protein